MKAEEYRIRYHVAHRHAVELEQRDIELENRFLLLRRELEDALVEKSIAKAHTLGRLSTKISSPEAPCVAKDCSWYDISFDQNCAAETESGGPWLPDCPKYQPEEIE